MVVLLFYFQVLAAGGKDDSPDYLRKAGNL